MLYQSPRSEDTKLLELTNTKPIPICHNVETQDPKPTSQPLEGNPLRASQKAAGRFLSPARRALRGTSQTSPRLRTRAASWPPHSWPSPSLGKIEISPLQLSELEEAPIHFGVPIWLWLSKPFWYHFGVGAPPILEPILVGIWDVHGGNRASDQSGQQSLAQLASVFLLRWSEALPGLNLSWELLVVVETACTNSLHSKTAIEKMQLSIKFVGSNMFQLVFWEEMMGLKVRL